MYELPLYTVMHTHDFNITMPMLVYAVIKQ